MTLSKDRIIDSIYNNNTDMNKSQATGAFGSTMEIIKSTLEKGEDVLVSGFGKFCVLGKKKRKGRNPQTGEDMILDERKVIVFKCSGKLRDKTNGVG